MKNILSKLVLAAFLFSALTGTAFAEDCKTCKKSATKKVAMQSKAAVCKRAQSTAELNVNNVRALINGYGNMWYDGSNPQYHLPKNSNTCPLFCAALWIGGTDVNDQLRIAALTFGSYGDDYWPGPLDLKTASVDLPVCNKYDKHYLISKTEVQAFMSMFDYDENGATPNETFSAEAVSATIKNWPAHGDNNQSPYLAPFYDANHDGQYSWEDGDYPYYDFNNDLCPRTLKAEWGRDYTSHVATTIETEAGIVTGGLLSDQVLKGDQTIWWVFNDMGDVHTESKGQPIGMEIRAQAFAFSTNDEINNMTFYTYEIINRSTYELRETYFSQWVDADLGAPEDDYVGCDVKRGLGYCYNGKESDGPGNSPSYSGIPPAVGIDFFQGPYMDPDGKDNPKIDIGKMRSFYPDQLERYRLADGTYDTISLTDDADLYYPNAWYFTPGDVIGNCAINGVNFGNNIVDDERFGMRRFIYYNNSDNNAAKRDPSKATDYYNYLRGYWLDGERMKYGGDGKGSGNGATETECDFMFPGNSDPIHWGTNGEDVADWTEVTAGNSPGDRRFMQSAGPFTLKPGALNYVTVGIPFAQATSGNAYSSVELLREIDDVCQALFENCFKVLDGPDAPSLFVQEMSNEIILYVKYDNPSSNNYGEKYSEVDPAIVRSYTDSKGNTVTYSDDQRSYKFEGYQIFQLKDANASIADIRDITRAQLVAQCDIENYYDSITVTNGDTTRNENPNLPIGTLVNYVQNSTTNLMVPQIMVEGANKGIQHVFRITTDAFAKGTDNSLVNNKEYYFVCVAYAQNRFKEYSQTEAAFLDGQKEPYLAGRKDEFGRSIAPVTAIPHDPSNENGGTVVQAEFGMCPNITRIEGYGNGGSVLRLTDASIEELMGAPGVPGKPAGKMKSDGSGMLANPCVILNPAYEENYGPVRVQVIDPLNVKAGKYLITFDQKDDIAKCGWSIVKSPEDPNYEENPYVYDDVMKVKSDFTIGRYNEQLFLDLGLAVAISNPTAVATPLNIFTKSTENYASRYYGSLVNNNSVLSATMTFADNSRPWLSGIPDNDDAQIFNWVRSGTQFAAETHNTFAQTSGPISLSEGYMDEDYFKSFNSGLMSQTANLGVDRFEVFESVIGGLWAPYGLCSTLPFHPGFCYRYYIADDEILDSIAHLPGVAARLYDKDYIMRQTMDNTFNKSLNCNDISKLPSVRIVLTSDTSKWTRCPVLEMCDDHTQAEGNARRFEMRKHLSVDKLGRTVNDLHLAADVDDPNNPGYINETGMGWFPGYAINVVTGERLNVIFGEDSRYIQYNGRDMMWNPVSDYIDGTQNYIMGGRHFIYVMNALDQPFYDLANNTNTTVTSFKTPSYDAGRWAVQMLGSLERLMNFVPTSDADGKRVNHGVVAGESTTFLSQRDSAAFFFASASWVNMPLVNARYEFDNPIDIPCDVTIDINVNTPYERFLAPNKTAVKLFPEATTQNNNYPMYMFELTPDIATLTGQATGDAARQSYKDSILSQIGVVPNPYYSYSTYETTSQLETKVRFTNVPTGTIVSIYTVDGTMVRRLGPTAGTATTLDWDLHNHTGLPIAGGIYLIHFDVPGIGERVVKWFGTMRPVDLNSFGF